MTRALDPDRPSVSRKTRHASSDAGDRARRHLVRRRDGGAYTNSANVDGSAKRHPRRNFGVTTLIAAFAMAACSGNAVPTSSLPPPTAVATTSAPATATPPVSRPSVTPGPGEASPVAGVTALEFGCKSTVARCQNMPAGTYETWGWAALVPGLTLTLPAGWSSFEQDAGEFELHQAADLNAVSQIYFWSDVVAWVHGAPQPELGTTTDELATYLLSDSRLTVAEGSHRTLNVRGQDSLSITGAVQARSFSVIVSDSAVTDPEVAFDCPAEACIGLLTDPVHWAGAAPFELLRNMPVDDPDCLCSQAVRLYVATVGSDLDPHTLVIALSTSGADALQALTAWEAQVEPIIASVLVPYIVVDN